MTTRDRTTAAVYGAGALLSLAVTVSDGWPWGIALSALAVILAFTLWSTTMYPFRTENDGLDDEVQAYPPNAFDDYNLQLRAAGAVFAGGQNNTRCSLCGAQGAEYCGDMNDAGESIAVCPEGCDKCPEDDE